MKEIDKILEELDFLKLAAMLLVLIIVFSILGIVLSYPTNYGRYFTIDTSVFCISAYFFLYIFSLMQQPEENDRWIPSLEKKLAKIKNNSQYQSDFILLGVKANKQLLNLSLTIIGVFFSIIIIEVNFSKSEQEEVNLLNSNSYDAPLTNVQENNQNYQNQQETEVPNVDTQRIASINNNNVNECTESASSASQTILKLQQNFSYALTINYIDSLCAHSKCAEIENTICENKRKELSEFFNDVRAERIVQIYHRHRIKQGETILSIANKYGTTQDKILTINNLTTDKILSGKIIIIPMRAKVFRYKIGKGEQIVSIAKKFRIWKKEILELNKMSDETIYEGKYLLLFEAPE